MEITITLDFEDIEFLKSIQESFYFDNYQKTFQNLLLKKVLDTAVQTGNMSEFVETTFHKVNRILQKINQNDLHARYRINKYLTETYEEITKLVKTKPSLIEILNQKCKDIEVSFRDRDTGIQVFLKDQYVDLSMLSNYQIDELWDILQNTEEFQKFFED